MQPAKHLFVLMPFDDEFDDVYLVIQSACADPSLTCQITPLRADEIARPGKITDQILAAISSADAIIADITRSNPNVMYELGYADALGKPAILLNQSVSEAPFDIRGLRQILYDRSRLVKDCRRRLVTALAELLDEQQAVQVGAVPSQADGIGGGEVLDTSVEPLQLTHDLVAQIQTFHINMELANDRHDMRSLRELALRLLSLVDRITVLGKPSPEMLLNTVGVIGNCAVELERGGHYQDAESLWRRALALCPTHAGLRVQYADFLIDRDRVEEASEEVSRARELAPDDSRLPAVEAKLADASGTPDSVVGSQLKEAFYSNPSNDNVAMVYLRHLAEGRVDLEQYEAVCRTWMAASPNPDAADAGLRMIADHAAVLKLYEKAKQLYETILTRVSGSNLHDVLHNLASVSAASGDYRSALVYWSRSYNMDRADPLVRAAFSSWLAHRGQLEEGRRVIEGEPLPESLFLGVPLEASAEQTLDE